MEDSENELSTVLIPASLYKKIAGMINGTGFDSVSGYITYVMMEVVSEQEAETEPFSKEDEEMVKQRLRALGYL